MSFSFASMIRLLALGTVGLTILAVSISRLTPAGATRRFESPVTAISISDYLLGVPDRQPRWLDTAGGTIKLTPLQGDDVLEAASCSPWVDAQGRRQVVGRWSNRTLNGTESVAHDFGIARFSYPEGRLIDQASLENFPVSPPCWLPGDRAQVLFVAGDGQLHRFDFEASGATDDSARPVVTGSQASMVAWACPRPGAGDVFFGEITCPRLPDSRLQNLVVATLRVRQAESGGKTTLSRSAVWWLRLDPTSTRITAAGPLIDRPRDQAQTAKGDEHNPTVALRPDGSVGIAFARAVGSTPAWSVCLGTVAVAPDGHPVCHESTVRVLDVLAHLAPVVFSTDGRWLNALIVHPGETPTVGRYRTMIEAIARLDPVIPNR